jgi:hypothetical protein
VGGNSAFSGSGSAAGVGVVVHDILILLVSRRAIRTGQQVVCMRRENKTDKIFLSLSMMAFR